MLFPAQAERFVAGNRVKYHPHADRALAVMHRAIEKARYQVLVEMYWLDADTTGRRFLDALQGAAERGLDVYVVYDAVGSWTTGRSHFERLRGAGVHVYEYGPLPPLLLRWRLEKMMQRDHRKLIAVDGQTAYVGGVNLADQWLSEAAGGKGWKDEVLQLEGPVVSELIQCFADTYRRVGGGQLPLLSDVGGVEPGHCSVAVLTGRGPRGRHRALRAYCERIAQANRRVYLSSAYFVPPRRIIRALVKAAKRGVEVCLLLPDRSDMPVVPYASRAMWEQLLRGGVKIYQFDTGILHSKTAVVDSCWVTIGSFNLDYQSIGRLRELNVAVLDEELGKKVEQHFLEALATSKQISLEQFQSRSRLVRIVERMAYAARYWL